MKKMKKILALALAFVLAVTILPMVGREEAKAASIPGYYRWYMDRSGNSQFVTEGTPVVSGLTGFVVPSGNKRLYASDYTHNGDLPNTKKDSEGNYGTGVSISAISVKSHGETNTYERSCRLDSNNYVTFTALCDGTIEMCYKPGGTLRVSTYLTVNGEQVGDTIDIDPKRGTYGSFAYLKAEETWVYEMSVEKGESYKIAAANDIALSQIIFEPSPVSALGGSYRKATDKYTNGIRFGSTIDKTKISYKSVSESGTLIARKTTMDRENVKELTMDSVGKVCLKVKRTTYIKDEPDGVLEYAAAIVNIPKEKLGDEFVARSYVVIDGVTYYGAQMIDTWNSVKAKADAKVE